MSSIQTGIQLNDQFTGVLYGIINSVNLAVSAMDEMNQTMNQPVDTNMLDGTIEQISQATMLANGLNQAMQDIETPIRENVNEQENFNNKIQQGVSNAQSFVKALMGLSVVQSVVGLVEGQIDSAISRMDTMTNYNRTMTAITGSSEIASASLEKLKEVTTGTAYGLDVAASSVQNFVTRGMAIGNAVNEVSNWADAVAFYGDGTNETLSTVTDALGKMLSKGTVEMEQLNRLTDAGINAVGIYAQATGGAVSDIQTSLSKGEISSQEFITTVSSAFENGTNGVLNLSGAAMDAGATWETSITNAKAAVTRGIIDMIDGINQSLSNAGYGTILDGIKEFGVQTENTLSKVGAFAGSTITMIMPLIDTVKEMFSYITDNANISLDSILADITNFVNITVILLQLIFSFVSAIATFVVDNWGMIAPIIGGIVAAMIAYNSVLVAYNTISAISAAITTARSFAASVYSASLALEAGATFTATAAQYGFNAALLACPLTWIILLIIALIAVVIAVANHVANLGGTATTTFGVITGGVNVVIQFFKNLGLEIANIALGIGNAIAALGSNIMTAFHNAICSVQSWWYDLLSTVLSVIAGICGALNSLPFIEFDYSGITSAADDYAARSAEAANNKWDYQSISDAFNEGHSTFNTFGENWVADAYSSGAAWGDGVSNKVKNMFSSKASEISTLNERDYADALANGNNNTAATAANTAKTADSAEKAAKSLDISSENLKYLHDIAERDVTNRYTTASITVNQTNNNSINNNMDLDGVTEHLRTTVEEQMNAAAEGVH